MWFIKAKNFVSKILLETIPSYLLCKLRNILEKDIHQNRLPVSNLSNLVVGRKVYDLVNCGPMNRFMAGNLIAHNCGYGASWKTIQSHLLLQGYALSDMEAQIIHRDYWRLYPGIKRFEHELRNIWTKTGGWVPSSMGNPICVYHGFLHDIVNRFAQRSGHEVLMKLVYHTELLRQSRGVKMYPWIPDWHDEQIWEVPEDSIDAAFQLMKDAEANMNEELKWDVYMEAEPEIADNLAQIKCDKEDYDEWIAKHGTHVSQLKLITSA